MPEEPIIRDIKNLKSTNPDVRWSGVNNLRKYLLSHPGDYRARMITKSILNMVKDPDDKIREMVITTLAEIFPHGKKLEPIIMRSLSDKSPSIRSLSLEWLSNQNHPILGEYTKKFLRDDSEAVRKAALEIVISKQITGVEDILLQLLKSESGGVRRSVIFVLGKIKTPQAVGTLIEIMRNSDYDDLTRNQASSALERIGGRKLILPFIENLTDPNDYVRETAATYLKKNESEMISVITSSGKIIHIASLQYATDNTKQDFNSAISSLTAQMSFMIKDLKTELLSRNKIDFKELMEELQTIDTVIRILVEQILNLRLHPQKDSTYLTDTGLKNQLIKEFETNKSFYLPYLRKKERFEKVEPEILSDAISSIQAAQRINNILFLEKELFSSLKSQVDNIGILELSLIEKETNLKLDIIKKELIPVLHPLHDGWYNSKNEYMTKNYLETSISRQIEQYHIISPDKFLKQIRSPKIDKKTLKHIINSQHHGTWLEDINVFIEESEYQNIKQNAVRIDESLVKHLLSPIELDFSTFLNSLQRILDIQTFKTKSGQLISLESLHPIIQQKVLEKGYLSIAQLMKELKLDSSVKSIIVDYLKSEFQGRTDPQEDFFFKEQLIADVQKEILPLGRINFNVLSFKLDLSTNVLIPLIKQILSVKGITNTMEEFITLKGINQEIKEMIEHRNEFKFQELFELLEITKDQKNEEIIRDIVNKDNKLWISRDKMSVMTHKGAFKKIISYLKSIDQRNKQKIGFDEISQKTNVPKEHVHAVIQSLIDNSLLTGSLEDKAYLV